MVRPVPGLTIEIRALGVEKNWGNALRWRNTACRDGPQHRVLISTRRPQLALNFSLHRAACALALWSACASTVGAAGLRDSFDALRAQRAVALVDQAVYLASTESADALQGQVFALVERPFAQVRQALAPPGAWCDVLILHLNVKYCRASGAPGQEVLEVGLGRKFDQPLADVHWLRLAYRLVSASDQQLKLELVSAKGPLGTHDYRIEFEAVPYAAGQTLLQLRYGYGYALAARWAMQVYLASLGRDKPGFTLDASGPQGRPQAVGGLRGVLERNTVRYYLAIEAYLGAKSLPAAQQTQKSLQDWFDATERYAEQLHELPRDEYLVMKQRELQRQATEIYRPNS